MAYTALYRAFRPKTFGEVVGQEHIKTTLKNQIKLGRVGHAYLLNGTRGTGKTSIAKILARAVNCEKPNDGEPCNECEICKAILEGSLTDVVEMDAASNNSVEDIRDIRNEVNFLPTRAKYRVYIIDEVHMLSTGAFNALLKTLEEPPEHVKFILATTEPQKIPATILSRCQRFDFKKLSNENIVSRLEYVCEKSNVRSNKDALNLIAVLSEGAMRDALSILERCIQDGEENINIDKIKDLVGIPKLMYVHNIIQAIFDKNMEKTIEQTDLVVDEGKDLLNFLFEMIKYVNDILEYKIGKKLEIYSLDEIEKIKKLSINIEKEKLIKIIYRLSELENRLKQSSQKIIIFKTEMINLCINNDTDDLEERLKKIEHKLKEICEDSYTVNKNIVSEKKQVLSEKNEINEENNSINKQSKTENYSKIQQNSANTLKNNTAKYQNFWLDVLQKLKTNGKVMIYANLLNSRAIEINDMTIGIEFPNGLNDFRKKLLEKSENLNEIKKLVSIACGKEMEIKYLDKSSENVKIVNQEEKNENNYIKKDEIKKINNNSLDSLDDLENLGLSINYIDE